MTGRKIFQIELGLWLLAFVLLAVGWLAVGWGTAFDDNPGDPLMPAWFVLAMLVLIPGTLFFALSGVVRAFVLAAKVAAGKTKRISS